MSLTLSNRTIEKYLGFLKRLDNNSKKKLIIKLTESIETGDDKKSFELNSVFGAWKDNRSADEIIKDIRASRTFNRDPEEF